MSAATAIDVKRGNLRRSARLWAAPLLLVVLYPELLQLFAGAASAYRKTGSLFHAGSAVLLILLACSIPAIVLRALLLIRQESDSGSVLIRSMLYLMFAVSPLYIFSLQLTGLAGAGRSHSVIWIFAWAATGAVLYFRRHESDGDASASAPTWLRVVHGGAALCLLAGFVLLHLVNHMLALWSVNLHGEAMEWLRAWYRSRAVEPVLLTLLPIMVATGVPLVVHYSRRAVDTFRVIQMATGVYIALFLCAHLLAVLGARSMGVETDWVFATGQHGLLDGRSLLIPYYLFSVFFMVLHAACGLRIVLLKHHACESVANKVVYAAAGIGAVITLAIAIATFGFHAV